MITGSVFHWSVLAVLLAALMCLGALCDMTIVNPPEDNTGGTGDTGGTGGSDDGASDGGNPNSSCANTTDVEVAYVNESTARVVFVENFRDESYAVISSKILALKPVGDPDATILKCIACPYQAGIRNIKYVEDGVTTPVPFPEDLYRPAFACGDRITFTFGADGTVWTSVQRP